MNEDVIANVAVVLVILFCIYDSFKHVKEDIRKTNRRHNFIVAGLTFAVCIVIMPFWIGLIFFILMIPYLILVFKLSNKRSEYIWDHWFKK